MTSVKIIAVLVENRPGVLFKVANMIRRRSFNIESITVGTVDHKDISRMTITLHADDAIVEQLVKQLSKLIDVIEANVFTPEEVIARELAIIQLSPDVRLCSQNLTNIMGHFNHDSILQRVAAISNRTPAKRE